VPPDLADPATRRGVVEDIHRSLLARDDERGTDLEAVLAEVHRTHPLLPLRDVMAIA
jgi:hypothetical protein